MHNQVRHASLAAGIALGLLVAAVPASAQTAHVELVNACLAVSQAYCTGGQQGATDLPGTAAATAEFDNIDTGEGFEQTLNVIIDGSVPNATHELLACPGELSPATGFTGCTAKWTVDTDGQGHGELEWDSAIGGNLIDGCRFDILLVKVGAHVTALANVPPAARNADGDLFPCN